MSTYLYPSKRPKVGDVKEWIPIFIRSIEKDWRGIGGSVHVSYGYPFRDFYKVRYWADGSDKAVVKHFYGESAVHEVRNYVYDLGFRDAHYDID